jgi:hypothetical protein
MNGDHMLWLGRAEAGIFFKLRGDSALWGNPYFGGGDFPRLWPGLQIPDTWGGVGAGARNNTKPDESKGYAGAGATVSTSSHSVDFATFSGKRTIASGSSVTFRWDMVSGLQVQPVQTVFQIHTFLDLL